MPANRQREKLVNAITYFARNTDKFGLVKMYKLLYFLDFEHYKSIGRSVTGLEYNAWPQGPLPPKLDEEIREGIKPDLAAAIDIDLRPFGNDKKFYKITAKGRENHLVFTPKEEAIMKRLATDFKYADAEQMSEESHLPNTPWERKFVQEKDVKGEIPYDYGVPDEDKDLIAYIRWENGERNPQFDSKYYPLLCSKGTFTVLG